MAATLRRCNREFRLAFRAVMIMVARYGKPFNLCMERGGSLSIESPYLDEALTDAGGFARVPGH